MPEMSDQHDTVVVKDGGSNAGVLIALVALVIVVAGAWYFLMGPGAGTSTAPNDINVNVELPSVAPASS
jgi:hypothetical protein